MYAGILHDTEEKDDLTCQAIQWLTKALKFNPQHTDAWCELGDSCWRQGDPVQAASHFRQALKIDVGLLLLFTFLIKINLHNV
ncbi:unnamed protein product [Trichobilharzia regenti]|nr:unnamed protein product [Trichobilharzia regenti]